MQEDIDTYTEYGPTAIDIREEDEGGEADRLLVAHAQHCYSSQI